MNGARRRWIAGGRSRSASEGSIGDPLDDRKMKFSIEIGGLGSYGVIASAHA